MSVPVSTRGVVLLELRMKVNGECYWNVLLSQQMLDVIKHITDDSFVFQQDKAPVLCMRNAIQFLLQCEIPGISSFLLSYAHPTARS